ncbi:MAG: DUF4382 domain-containing protein [Nitrospirae bacterium]|nr:DUF4382 domain-containing protein [Nitrospirota bacterium]
MTGERSISKGFSLSSYVLLVLSLLGLSCTNSGSNTPGEITPGEIVDGKNLTGESRIVVKLTDAPADLEALSVTLSELLIHFRASGTGSQWIRISGETQVELLSLQNGQTLKLGSVGLGQGTLIGIGFGVSSATAVVGGQRVPVDVPTGTRVSVDFETSYGVGKGEQLSITLDFDAKRSVVERQGQGLLLFPIVEIKSVETTQINDPPFAKVFTPQLFGGRGWSIVQTGDGGFAVAGEASVVAGPNDLWLVRLDPSGNVIWQKRYGGAAADFAQSIVQTSDGGFALAGHTESFGAGNADFWVLRLDGAGNVIWQKAYGGSTFDAARSIVQTGDGGFAVAGEATSFAPGGVLRGWILRLDGSGNIIWQRASGGPSADGFQSIVQTMDGGFAVAGSTSSFGIGDAWVVRLDGAGNVIWQKAYGGAAGDSGQSIVQTSDGGFAVAGSTGSFGAGSSDAWVLRIDSAGNVMSQKAYGGSGMDVAFSIVNVVGGGFAFAGRTDSFDAGDTDAWVVRLDAAGNAEWQKVFNLVSFGFATEIVHTVGGGFAVSGFGSGVVVLNVDAGGNVPICPPLGDTLATVTNTLAGAQPTSSGITATTVSPSPTSAIVSDTVSSEVQECPLPNNPPVITSGPSADPTTVNEGGTVSLSVQASDPDGDPLSFLWSAPAGTFSNPSLQNPMWTSPQVDADQTITITVQVSDGQGGVTSGSVQVTVLNVPPPPSQLVVALDIDPNTLNIRSQGNPVTAVLEVTQGGDSSQIVVATLTLNAVNSQAIAALSPFNKPVELADANGNGVQDLKVQFSRQALISALKGLGFGEGDATIQIQGQLTTGSTFSVTDTIKVIERGK